MRTKVARGSLSFSSSPMACAFQNCPKRSQREIVQALRCPIDATDEGKGVDPQSDEGDGDQRRKTERGLSEFNHILPLATAPKQISISIDQFMAGQLFPSQQCKLQSSSSSEQFELNKLFSTFQINAHHINLTFL